MVGSGGSEMSEESLADAESIESRLGACGLEEFEAEGRRATPPPNEGTVLKTVEMGRSAELDPEER